MSHLLTIPLTQNHASEILFNIRFFLYFFDEHLNPEPKGNQQSGDAKATIFTKYEEILATLPKEKGR